MKSIALVLTAAAAQILALVNGYPVLAVAGMFGAAAALFYHHRSRGHGTRYVAFGTLTALIPVWGPVLGLLLKPPPEAESPEAVGLSYRSWGSFLLFPALMTSMVPRMLGPTMGLAFLSGTALSYGAWGLARAGRGGLALALFVSSFGACGGLAYHSLQSSDLVLLSEAGATRGNLSAIRQALSQAAAENKGARPANLTSVVGPGKALEALPPAKLRPYHGPSSAIEETGAVTDAGGWTYDAVAGTVRVNCTHTDSKGSVWASY